MRIILIQDNQVKVQNKQQNCHNILNNFRGNQLPAATK